jgi:hypothetical protein
MTRRPSERRRRRRREGRERVKETMMRLRLMVCGVRRRAGLESENRIGTKSS